MSGDVFCDPVGNVVNQAVANKNNKNLNMKCPSRSSSPSTWIFFMLFLKKLKSIENRFKLMSDGRCYLVVKSPKKYESARSEFCYRQHLFPRINIVIFNKKICRRSCAGLGASLATPLQAESAHMLMKLGTNCISLKINKHYIFLFASAWLSAEQLLGFPHDRPGGSRRGVQRRVKHFPQKILLINNITVPCF